ncbi:Oidioi.mRNA.OKI2018_I69.PAR.g10247.t1.cds [Oikopleura dioica]|uniref:Oidioi.mRNA.OKI2018_I69.PAR.g10247.t1.cds n=1 Tax=Oikopleura dioica TaxID=34765 RepID=A0ABN7RSS0_OIKDI|nr:Oidioi.mRNA.OKI2018_I69.PAR.g10247.t1.cds [Oikopleura dioica]
MANPSPSTHSCYWSSHYVLVGNDYFCGHFNSIPPKIVKPALDGNEASLLIRFYNSYHEGKFQLSIKSETTTDIHYRGSYNICSGSLNNSLELTNDKDYITIHSPNYPQVYEFWINCIAQIKSNLMLTLIFHDFQFYNFPPCSVYLSINDVKYCGHDIPEPIIINSSPNMTQFDLDFNTRSDWFLPDYDEGNDGMRDVYKSFVAANSSLASEFSAMYTNLTGEDEENFNGLLILRFSAARQTGKKRKRSEEEDYDVSVTIAAGFELNKKYLIPFNVSKKCSDPVKIDFNGIDKGSRDAIGCDLAENASSLEKMARTAINEAISEIDIVKGPPSLVIYSEPGTFLITELNYRAGEDVNGRAIIYNPVNTGKTRNEKLSENQGKGCLPG